MITITCDKCTLPITRPNPVYELHRRYQDQKMGTDLEWTFCQKCFEGLLEFMQPIEITLKANKE